VSFISAVTKMQFCDCLLTLLASALQRGRPSATPCQITGIWGWTGHMAAFFGKAGICASIPSSHGWECSTRSCCCPPAFSAPPGTSFHPISLSLSFICLLTFQYFKTVNFHFVLPLTNSHSSGHCCIIFMP